MKELKNNERLLVETDEKYVIKHYRQLSNFENELILSKLELKNEFSSISGLITPLDYTVHNGKISDVYTKYIDLPDFFVSSEHPMIDFKTITEVCENLYQLLTQLANKGLICTDLTSWGNLKYDPKTFMPYILDYEDHQIKEYPSCRISYHINHPICQTFKYCRDGLYDKNINSLQLLLRWYSLCTSLDFYKTSAGNMSMAYTLVNLTDQEMIEHFNKLFNTAVDNDDLTGTFRTFYDKYDLEKMIPEQLSGLFSALNKNRKFKKR